MFMQHDLDPQLVYHSHTMDKQNAIALGVTAGLTVGYFLGKTHSAATIRTTAEGKPPANDLNEVERLIRPNILALTPYRCARDDYDQGIGLRN